MSVYKRFCATGRHVRTVEGAAAPTARGASATLAVDRRDPMIRTEYTVTAEINVEEFFADESAEYSFCFTHCTFQHRDQPEFILHVGSDERIERIKELAAEMRKAELRQEFIDLFLNAADAGAVRIIFYAA
jgi:hypothetical protein